MSGSKDMDSWERELQPGRDHIEKAERLQRYSQQARDLSNTELARELYEIAAGLEDPKAMKLVEAAERLGAAVLAAGQTPGEN